MHNRPGVSDTMQLFSNVTSLIHKTGHSL